MRVVPANDDDSTGKGKGLRARGTRLTGVFLVGVCLGLIVSEKVYLVTQEADLPEGAVAALRSRKLELAGSVGVRFSGEPRNQLEGLLQRVAPQGEVMIAISNYDLIPGGELVMWLEVSSVVQTNMACPAA